MKMKAELQQAAKMKAKQKVSDGVVLHYHTFKTS
jgi:hypothetical protein